MSTNPPSSPKNHDLEMAEASEQPFPESPAHEDKYFGPPIDKKLYSAPPSSRWVPEMREPRPQVDDEDDDTEALPDPLEAYRRDVHLPPRERTRDLWGREINLDDKPVNHCLPSRLIGPQEFLPEQREPRFNGSLSSGRDVSATDTGVVNKWGLTPSDFAEILGADMDAVGLDPCVQGEEGRTAVLKVQSVMPGDIPPAINEPPLTTKRHVEYDFSSIEMLLTGDVDKVVPLRIKPCFTPSPVGVGQLPANRYLTTEWRQIMDQVKQLGPEIAAAWWIAHITYYMGVSEDDYSGHSWLRSMRLSGEIPMEVLGYDGPRLDWEWHAPLSQTLQEDGVREPLTNTFWTPKVKHVDGFPHNWWHPREGNAKLDTRFRPVPVLQNIRVPAAIEFGREAIPEKTMWDGIPGHTFRLPPYRYYDHYSNSDGQPGYLIPDMAIDFRRIPVKNALRDASKDKYEDKFRGYRVKPAFSSESRGQVLGSGERKIDGKLDWVAVADEVDPWGVPGGGEGRDYVAERRNDLDGYYQYFVVNNDPHERPLKINGSIVKRGFVAGPLPAFAIIEADENIGFWHGKNGAVYDFQAAQSYDPRRRDHYDAMRSDDESDEGFDDEGPKKVKRRGKFSGWADGRVRVDDLRQLGILPPKFGLAMRPKPQDPSEGNYPRPAGRLKFGQPNQKEATPKKKDPNDVFGDDEPISKLEDLMVNKGINDPVDSPSQKLIPIIHDDYLANPMQAISKYVHANRPERSVEMEDVQPAPKAPVRTPPRQRDKTPTSDSAAPDNGKAADSKATSKRSKDDSSGGPPAKKAKPNTPQKDGNASSGFGQGYLGFISAERLRKRFRKGWSVPGFRSLPVDLPPVFPPTSQPMDEREDPKDQDAEELPKTA